MISPPAGTPARRASCSSARRRIRDLQRAVEAAPAVAALDPVAALGRSPVAPSSLVADRVIAQRNAKRAHGKTRVPEGQSPGTLLHEDQVDLGTEPTSGEIRDAGLPEEGRAPRRLALEGRVIYAEIAERYGRPFRSPSAPPSPQRPPPPGPRWHRSGPPRPHRALLRRCAAPRPHRPGRWRRRS